jgi:hypothetical protein
MKHWFTVLLDGEARVIAEADPGEFVADVLSEFGDEDSDVEFEFEPESNVCVEREDGPDLWVVPFTMRFMERFWTQGYAESAAAEKAIEVESTAFRSGDKMAFDKITFRLSEPDTEDWDDPEGATKT